MRDDPSVGTVLAGSINAISTEVTEQRSPSGCRFTIAASAANAYAIDRRYPFIAEL
jgi:hypothetical protein